MAAITSTATGNWAAGGTWVGGVPPGSGDTAIIANGHTVTIAAGTTVTVGDSTTPLTVPAISSTNANGTGILVVGAGATLTVLGSVRQGNANWTVNASATINFAHATQILYWQITDDGGTTTNAKLVFAGGTGANRITVQATLAANGGGFGNVTATKWVDGGKIEATGVQFTRIGTGTSLFLDYRPSAAYVGFFDDCLFTSCGEIANSVNAPAGATIRFRRTTFRTPAASNGKCATILLAAGAHTGIVVDRARWEGQLAFGGAASGVTGVSMTDNVGRSSGTAYPMECGANPFSGTVDQLYLFNSIALSGNPARVMNGTITDLCSYRIGQGAGGNGHAMIVDVRSTTSIVGGVWEMGENDPAGDQFQIESNPATAQTLNVQNVISPPCPNGTMGAGSFVNISHAGSSANNRITVQQCTAYVTFNGTDLGGCVMTENTTGGAGVFVAVQNMLWYRDTSGSGWGIGQNGGVLTNGTYTNCNYNCRYNSTDDGYQPADVAFTSPTPPGTNDITVNPVFVDSTRNFLKWGQSITPSLTTASQVCDELMKRNDDAGYTAGFTIAAYLAYMRAGFTPTVAAIGTSGITGTRIGAVDVVVAAASASASPSGVKNSKRRHVVIGDNRYYVSESELRGLLAAKLGMDEPDTPVAKAKPFPAVSRIERVEKAVLQDFSGEARAWAAEIARAYFEEQAERRRLLERQHFELQAKRRAFERQIDDDDEDIFLMLH